MSSMQPSVNPHHQHHHHHEVEVAVGHGASLSSPNNHGPILVASSSVPRDDDDVDKSYHPPSSPFGLADDDNAVIAAPPEDTHEEDASTTRLVMMVAEIPPEECKPSAATSNDNGNNKIDEKDDDNDGEEEEESDWGDASDYEYEDDDDMGFSGFLVSGPAPARIEQDQQQQQQEQPKPQTKWKEPTPEAVGMSLRAQSESSGGRRRLAQDLYKIMNQDTEEAGFSLAPKSEDSMDLWTIKLFQFDEESNLSKDMRVLNIDHIELEMKFPNQYPFEPPFVRVVRPRFKRQTGFVMNGALCMELLTKEGWNPINDIESVIVSIRSLLVVGDGRLAAAAELSTTRYEALLEGCTLDDSKEPATKKSKTDDQETASSEPQVAAAVAVAPPNAVTKEQIGSYTASEARSAYSHLSDYHKKKGWDNSGWWSRKG